MYPGKVLCFLEWGNNYQIFAYRKPAQYIFGKGKYSTKNEARRLNVGGDVVNVWFTPKKLEFSNILKNNFKVSNTRSSKL